MSLDARSKHDLPSRARMRIFSGHRRCPDRGPTNHGGSIHVVPQPEVLSGVDSYNSSSLESRELLSADPGVAGPAAELSRIPKLPRQLEVYGSLEGQGVESGTAGGESTPFSPRDRRHRSGSGTFNGKAKYKAAIQDRGARGISTSRTEPGLSPTRAATSSTWSIPAPSTRVARPTHLAGPEPSTAGRASSSTRSGDLRRLRDLQHYYRRIYGLSVYSDAHTHVSGLRTEILPERKCPWTSSLETASPDRGSSFAAK